jgi:hypothetical protein
MQKEVSRGKIGEIFICVFEKMNGKPHIYNFVFQKLEFVRILICLRHLV